MRADDRHATGWAIAWRVHGRIVASIAGTGQALSLFRLHVGRTDEDEPEAQKSRQASRHAGRIPHEP
jgi:hypothetical protein